ncbi:hypothetical protein RSOL_032180 [Rhizoctonia solani AG-3 Rhs1AP]|uniref:Uncharacterized protein n=1 Tax=Rhizoctonia solani AG-3 Rhs1AP TaxID=1086054 RepID=X8IVK7_9AGAM|nr:hypothetical protein RSOL_032180 [Rhizoctonia solani AG-3 Rhs1AP]
MPEAEPSALASPQGHPSVAGPSHTQASGTSSSGAGHSSAALSGTGSSAAGPSTLAKPHSSAGAAPKPTPVPKPDTREAPDEDPRPSKKARIDPSSGDKKGKQKAVPTDQPPIDTTAQPPAQDGPPTSVPDAKSPLPLPDTSSTSNASVAPPPRDSAVPTALLLDQAPESSGSSRTPPALTTRSIQDWNARRNAAVLQHETMRTVNAQVDQDGASEETLSRATVNSAPLAPVHEPSPPPTSTPDSPVTAWITWPLTQVYRLIHSTSCAV